MFHKTEIMDAQGIERALVRIAHEILERNKGTKDLVLIGIQRRGVPLAKRIAAHIAIAEGHEVPVGVLDITFYRDDLSLLNDHPVVKGTDVPFVIKGSRVVLVDDVLYTAHGSRSDRSADGHGTRAVHTARRHDRPRAPRAAFAADFVGKTVPTSRSETVHVQPHRSGRSGPGRDRREPEREKGTSNRSARAERGT